MRRRKPRVVWLPQTNANSIGDGSQVYQLGIIGVAGATGQSVTKEIPLVLDTQVSAVFGTEPSLADIESSGYRLRRIVGKLWCEVAQQDIFSGAGIGAITGPSSCIVSAGIIVRRADSTGTSYASQVGVISEEIDVGKIDNTGDPWVWRRSWTLGDNNALQLLSGTAGAVQTQSRQFFPTTNFGNYAGGNSDGAHVDQKTARLVSSEERLFLDVTVTILGESPNQPDTNPITVAFWTDLRVLGSLRTTSGNRRNASR